MIGSIILPYKAPTLPQQYNYFDPETQTATESDFIRLLEDEIYSDEIIGFKVRLSNSVLYDNKTQIIADINHDSENTEQTNCYDLISEKCLSSSSTQQSNTSGASQTSSIVYKNYIQPLYNGFDNDFKTHMLQLKYQSVIQGGYSRQYSDYVTSPSARELKANSGPNEGITYPIFTDDNSRIKTNTNNQTTRYQTRSINPNSSNTAQYVTQTGNISSQTASSNYENIIALIRVQ